MCLNLKLLALRILFFLTKMEHEVAWFPGYLPWIHYWVCRTQDIGDRFVSFLG